MLTYWLHWTDREIGAVSRVAGDFPSMYGDFTPVVVDPAFREFFDFIFRRPPSLVSPGTTGSGMPM